MVTKFIDNPEDKQDLYNLLQSFMLYTEYAPWRWMTDTDIFAVEIPGEKELYYACVMGCEGEMFGMAIYQGLKGLKYYQRQLETEDPEEVAMIEEHGPVLLLTLGDRGELNNKERQLYKELGFSFRGHNAWPVFRSFKPGFYPWILTPAEAHAASIVLQHAIAAAEHCREHQKKWHENGGDHIPLCKVLPGSASENFTLEWMPFPEINDEEIRFAFDHNTAISAVSHLPKIDGEGWEIDWCYSPAPVQEKKGDYPFYPILGIIASRESGLILNFKLSTRDEFNAASLLIQTMVKFNKRPESLIFKTELKARSVLDLAHLLEIDFYLAQKLLLEECQASLLEQL
ncbi:MAG: hypothetical protein PHR65_11280 [Syntrophomonadaceae bacterium]|nr:hypothetical protein [Syntrophomonadaceae bacterium]